MNDPGRPKSHKHSTDAEAEERRRGALYRKTDIIAAIRECHGMVSLVSKRLGMTPVRLRGYIDRHAVIREAFEEVRLAAVDEAERGLWKAVENGEQWAILYALKSLGKERGFRDGGDKEVSGTVTHEHIHVWKERLQAAHTALEARRKQVLPVAYEVLPVASEAVPEPPPPAYRIAQEIPVHAHRGKPRDFTPRDPHKDGWREDDPFYPDGPPAEGD